MGRAGNKPLIRRFEPGDAAGFRALVEAVLGEYGFVPDPLLEADLRDPLASYDAVWVAADGEDVVGSAAVRRCGAGELELKRMYLDPIYRGRGLGRALLEEALSWARANGMSSVVLDTSEAMAEAQRLYESAGFIRYGSRVEEGAVDARCEVLYKLEL